MELSLISWLPGLYRSIVPGAWVDRGLGPKGRGAATGALCLLGGSLLVIVIVIVMNGLSRATDVLGPRYEVELGCFW